VEADEIAKRASHRLAQPAEVFEESLFKPSASPPSTGSELPPALPPPPEQGAPDYGQTSGDRVLLALARQEGVDWILELKAFLVSGKLPEEESEAKRIVRQASGYCIKDGDLYQHRPNGVALKCISTHQGQELLRDIHHGKCGHHASASTLAGKAYRSGFYWPSVLWDVAKMVKRCEACQFHAKQIHQPAQELQTIPLTWPFAVWGLDILGPFPRAQGGYLYIVVDKFTKCVEVEPVCTIPARSAVKFIRGLVYHFNVPNRIITDNGSQFTSGLF
jgi:transposase InsO family protein